jgi:hypothetical protein
MIGLLIGVHRTAERQHRVISRRISGRRIVADQPLVQPDVPRTHGLGEHSGTGIRLMDDREGPHGPKSAIEWPADQRLDGVKAASRPSPVKGGVL